MPFNLDEALKNPERVVYRDGQKPLEWHFIKSANVICKIVTVDTRKCVFTHSEWGRYNILDVESDFDLFLTPVPEKRYWINLYRSIQDPLFSKIFESLEDAENERQSLPFDLIKTISFTL